MRVRSRWAISIPSSCEPTIVICTGLRNCLSTKSMCTMNSIAGTSGTILGFPTSYEPEPPVPLWLPGTPRLMWQVHHYPNNLGLPIHAITGIAQFPVYTRNRRDRNYDALNPLVSGQFNDYQLSDLEFSILAIQHITSTGITLWNQWTYN